MGFFNSHEAGFGSRMQWGLALVCIAALACTYYYAIWSLSINLPWFDDYVQFLGTYLRLGQEYSLKDWFTIVLEQPQWNGLIKSDHRLGFARVTMMASQELIGEVNFQYLILFGNIFVVLWFLAAWASSPLARREPIIMLPIAFLVFSLAHWEAAVWASAALLYYPAAFFSFAAIAAALMWPRSLVPAVGGGALAALSQANGLLSYPVISAALWVSRRRRAAVLFALVSICAFALYFYDFSRPKGIPDYVSVGQAAKRIFVSWIQLQGSAVPNMALLVGITTMVIWCVFVMSHRWKSNPVLFWFGIWMLASMGAVAMGRASLSDEFVISQTRYRYYGICFLSVTFLLVMEQLEGKRIRHLLLAAMLLLSANNYIKETPVFWGHMKKTMVNGVLGANYYRMEGHAPEPSLWFPHVHEVARILGYTESQGLYAVPFRKEYVALPAKAPALPAYGQNVPMGFYLDFMYVGSRSIALAGVAEIGGGSVCSDTDTLLFLDSGTARYYFKPVRFARPEAKEFYAKPCQAFAAFINTEALPAGMYRVGASIVREGRSIAEGVHPETIFVNRAH
jgi:hypothetical protein